MPSQWKVRCGKALTLFQAELDGLEPVHAAPLQDLRQVAAVAEGVGQPAHAVVSRRRSANSSCRKRRPTSAWRTSDSPTGGSCRAPPRTSPAGLHPTVGHGLRHPRRRGPAARSFIHGHLLRLAGARCTLWSAHRAMALERRRVGAGGLAAWSRGAATPTPCRGGRGRRLAELSDAPARRAARPGGIVPGQVAAPPAARPRPRGAARLLSVCRRCARRAPRASCSRSRGRMSHTVITRRGIFPTVPVLTAMIRRNLVRPRLAPPHPHRRAPGRRLGLLEHRHPQEKGAGSQA